MVDQTRSGIRAPPGSASGSGGEINNPQVAWGGIGGSGRHAAEIMAELVRQPQFSRAVEDLVNLRGVDELIKRQPYYFFKAFLNTYPIF